MKLNNKKAIMMPFVKPCFGSVDDQDTVVKKLAQSAVIQFVGKGRKHNDLRWDHVGLCTSRKGKTKAVLIDLGYVSKVGPGEQADARKKMLEALGLS